MPKNGAADIICRWFDMDAQLAGRGLIVANFARKWGVSERQVRRDLDELREVLGLWFYIDDVPSREDGRRKYYQYFDRQPLLAEAIRFRNMRLHPPPDATPPGQSTPPADPAE